MKKSISVKYTKIYTKSFKDVRRSIIRAGPRNHKACGKLQ